MRIEIGNSYSQIIGLTTSQFKELRKELSYTTDPKAAYFSGAYKAYPRYLIDQKGNFPTGLLTRVLLFASNADWTIERVDNRRRPQTQQFRTAISSCPEPYTAQYKALASARHRGGIVMPTGTGKSLVIALLAKTYGVKTLIIVPTVQLKLQLTASLSRWFTDPSWITVENIDSTSLYTKKPYDMLIIDECHHAAANTYQKLNKIAWKDIYYRFFFTATYFRNQTNEHLLFEGICGPAVYRLSYKEAISNQYIVPVEAYYYDLPSHNTDAYTWSEVYSELVVNNEYRNKLIIRLLQKLLVEGRSTLCLVKEIAHGRLIESLTSIPFVSGEDNESRCFIDKFNKGEIKSLIGTTGVLGEGIDTVPTEYVVIAGLGKAKSAFLQQIGRGVRKYPGKESCKIVLFRDKSHKFCLRHFREQVKILKEEFGVKTLKLEDK